MKFLFVLTIQFLLIKSLAFASCDQMYTDEINKLNEGLRTIGNNPAALQVQSRRDSLLIVRNILTDISQNNLNGAATRSFSQKIQVNPRTVQRAIGRANKRNALCERGVLLGREEIADLIRSGKMF